MLPLAQMKASHNGKEPMGTFNPRSVREVRGPMVRNGLESTRHVRSGFGLPMNSQQSLSGE